MTNLHTLFNNYLQISDIFTCCHSDNLYVQNYALQVMVYNNVDNESQNQLLIIFTTTRHGYVIYNSAMCKNSLSGSHV